MHGSLKKLIIFFWAVVCCFPCALISTPPQTIPPELYDEFTCKGTIPVIYMYSDESYSSDQPLVYTQKQIQHFIKLAKTKQTNYYGVTDTYLYSALEKFSGAIRGKKVAVMGSRIPWYESVLLAYRASPVTIEYNKIISTDSRLEVMTVAEYEKNPQQFDAILSISSFEHDGLGRYGDPINPSGDLETMEKTKKMLKDGGLLFLAVPIGRDCLVWNLHRVYGKQRLKALLKGWEVVGSFGLTENSLDDPRNYDAPQPVLVLKPIRP
jgi:hypothetical protein